MSSPVPGLRVRHRALAALAALAIGVAAAACSGGDSAPTNRPAPAPAAATASPAATAASPLRVVTTPPGGRSSPPTSGVATPAPATGATSTRAPVPGTATRGPSPRSSPTPAAFAPRATKLTADGCCSTPQWLADAGGVFYYGAGGPGDGRIGTWAVPREGGPPQLLTTHYGAFSPDRSLVAYPQGALTRVARLDGTIIGEVTTAGARVFFSPGNDQVAWLVAAPEFPRPNTSLEPPSRVAVARVDGGSVRDLRVLPPVVRPETLAWFPDNRRLVFSARDAAGENPGLIVLDSATGELTRLVDGPYLENVAVAPDGGSIVYTATLQSNASENGVWLVRADGGGRRRLDFGGGYRWAPDGRSLVYVPSPATGPTDELWRYRLADGDKRPLVTAAQVRFAIGQDDWELAPDGTAIVYRSAIDGAIWTLRFAP